jgi:uncharacterized protein YyaL (SSP411 family)
MAHVLEHFWDQEEGYFFYTGKEQTDVIIRKKELYDGAVPSGNAVMTGNLVYLGKAFDDNEYTGMAERLLKSMAQTVSRYPASFAVWAGHILQQVTGTAEIAIVGTEAPEKLKELLRAYIPWKILQSDTTPDEAFPLLRQRGSRDRTLLYLCQNYVCREPVTSVSSLLAQLATSGGTI